MEMFTALVVLSGLGGSLWWDVHHTFRLSRWYYQLVCRVPAGVVRLDALPSPGRPLRGESLVIGISSEGLQVRSTQEKHHILLRVRADGQVRAGTSVWMWLCLLGWSAMMGLLVFIALLQPPLSAALLLPFFAIMSGGVYLMLRGRTREMVAAVERVVAAQLVEERLRALD